MLKNEYVLSEDFFNRVDNEFSKLETPIKKLIVVEHAVENSLSFLKYLCLNYDVYFIAKPKSKNMFVLHELSKICTVLNVGRNDLQNKNKASDILKNIVHNDSFAIIDIGGYFAKNYKDIEHTFNKQLIKIIEDTENGYQKYEHVLFNSKNNNIPILSVARSPLKIEEDYLVGHEIVIKSELFLAGRGTTLLGKNALVIGFGKIGHSICESLRSRGVNVSVCDKNYIRQAMALAHGFNYVDNIYEKLKNIDLLFIANGEQSIDTNKLKFIDLKNTVFCFSVTSADDTYKNSLYLGKLKQYGTKVPFKIVKAQSNKFIIANNGNAINFTFTSPTLSEYVQLTQAEMMIMLKKKINMLDNHIAELDFSSRNKIAYLWLNYIQERCDSNA